MQEMLLEDCQFTNRDLVEDLAILLSTVSSILSEVLGFEMLCAQWVKG